MAHAPAGTDKNRDKEVERMKKEKLLPENYKGVKGRQQG